MITVHCSNCGAELRRFKCQVKEGRLYYCNKSCHRIHLNNLNNPSKHRDLSGENNPMFGKHPNAWNKGVMGKDCHNWKGGLHKRKDGYFRININGERFLHHRVLVKAKDGQIVHHKDHNPSNNSIENLMLFNNQSEHVRFEANECQS